MRKFSVEVTGFLQSNYHKYCFWIHPFWFTLFAQSLCLELSATFLLSLWSVLYYCQHIS